MSPNPEKTEAFDSKRKSKNTPSVTSNDSVGSYFADLEGLPMLDREKEIELAGQLADGKHRALEALAVSPLYIEGLEELAGRLGNGDAGILEATTERGRDPQEIADLLYQAVRLHREAARLEAALRGRGKPASSHDSIRRRIRSRINRMVDALERAGLSDAVHRKAVEEHEKLLALMEKAAKRKKTGRRTLRPLSRLEREAGVTRTHLRRIVAASQEAEAEVARVRRKMTEANLRLVIYVAKHYRGRGVPMADLIQEGNLGLMRAVEKYDPEMGCRFATYACWWIRQSVVRAIAEQSRTIRLPIRAIDKVTHLFKCARRLRQELGREPTHEELACALDIGTDDVRRTMRQGLDPVSLDEPIGEKGDGSLAELVADRSAEPPSLETLRRDLADHTRQALATLDPREEKVLRMRFGLGGEREHTLKEIGRAFQVTRERIRQIEEQALRKLRHGNRSYLLEPFSRED